MFKIMRGLVVGLIVLNLAQVCSAGLVNYDRRARRAAAKTGAPPPAAPAVAATPLEPPAAAPAEEPAAQTEDPAIATSAEGQYDNNGDAKLQPAELTAYLTYVIKQVEEGEDIVAEGVLLKYDRNNDGKITYSEMLRIRDEIK